MSSPKPKERPIIFSKPMVRAILDGAKTQTRRIIKPTPHDDDKLVTCVGSSGLIFGMSSTPLPLPEVRRVRWDCPYGRPGDFLWVRETYLKHSQEPGDFCYRATHPDAESFGQMHGGWKASIYMPRAASRITLEIVDVLVERLQDISNADLVAEGCTIKGQVGGANGVYVANNLRGAYVYLFDSINGAGSWKSNPWVWAVSFQRVKPCAEMDYPC